MNLERIAGVAHQPVGDPNGRPKGIVVLTHGAGGDRETPLLQQVCDEWARRGWLAVRYNLPYRRRRPKGPPSGSAASDRAGIVEAITLCRGLSDGPLIAGGHSYGGPTEVVEITGARHDLRSKALNVPALAVEAALRLIS
jgi:predicted alpha/beta-hydrolase family hydrolase